MPAAFQEVPSAAMAEDVFGLKRCFPARFPVLPHPCLPLREDAERSDGGRGVCPRTMFPSTFPCPATPLPSPQGKVPSAAMAEEVFALERCFPARFPVLPHPCLPLRGRCRAQRWRKMCSASNDVFQHVSLSRLLTSPKRLSSKHKRCPLLMFVEDDRIVPPQPV